MQRNRHLLGQCSETGSGRVIWKAENLGNAFGSTSGKRKCICVSKLPTSNVQRTLQNQEIGLKIIYLKEQSFLFGFKFLKLSGFTQICIFTNRSSENQYLY